MPLFHKKFIFVGVILLLFLGNSIVSINYSIIFPGGTKYHVKEGDKNNYLITDFQYGNHSSENITVSSGGLYHSNNNILTVQKNLTFTHVVVGFEKDFQNISHELGYSVFHEQSCNDTCNETSVYAAYYTTGNELAYAFNRAPIVEKTFGDKNLRYDDLSYGSRAELLIKTGDYFIRSIDTSNYTYFKVYSDETGWLDYYYVWQYFNSTITYGDGSTYEKGFSFVLEIKQIAYKDLLSKDNVTAIINDYKHSLRINYDFPTSFLLFLGVAVVYRKRKSFKKFK